MGEPVGADAARRLRLDPVVAHGRGRGEALLHVALLEQPSLRRAVPPYAGEALASVETFVNIALRVFADTNPSKLREHMRNIEIQSLMRPSQVKPDA